MKVFNFHAKPWAPEEDAVLLRCVRNAPTPWEGLKAASAALGRSLSGCKNRFYHLTGESLASSPANRELHRLARVKGRLNAPDIERVARAAGVHYHSALAALASLHARGTVSDTCPGCSEVEALRARVRELEVKLGINLDPLEGKLTYHQESIALAGQILFRYALEKRGALPAPGICELAGRFDLACCKLEHALADLAAGKGSPGEVWKWQALLNACVERFLAEAGKSKISKITKEVV